MRESGVHEGGCLCGDIRYRIAGEPLGAVICSCRNCQKLGGPIPAAVRFRLADFAITAGAPALYRSSPEIARHFCGLCGTFLYWHHDGAKHVGVALASFDEPAAMPKPSVEIFASRRLPWVAPVAGIQTFAEYPGPGVAVDLPRA